MRRFALCLLALASAGLAAADDTPPDGPDSPPPTGSRPDAEEETLRRLIESALPDASQVEVAEWLEILDGMSVGEAAGLLEVRGRVGSVVLPGDDTTPLPFGDDGPGDRVGWSSLRLVPPPTDLQALLEATDAMIAALEADLVGAGLPGYLGVVPHTRGWPLRPDWRDGPKIVTGRPLDVTPPPADPARPVTSRRFEPGVMLFRVVHEETARFTRCGAFRVGPEGRLGLSVRGRFWTLDPPVRVGPESSADELAVSPEGLVTGGTDDQMLGQIVPQRIDRIDEVRREGVLLDIDGEFRAVTEPQGMASGRLAGSNVQSRPVREVLELLRARRGQIVRLIAGAVPEG
ncbi:MAG: hypothetical protein AAF532_06460 [Planctomycetota bacterium]